FRAGLHQQAQHRERRRVRTRRNAVEGGWPRGRPRPLHGAMHHLYRARNLLARDPLSLQRDTRSASRRVAVSEGSARRRPAEESRMEGDRFRAGGCRRPVRVPQPSPASVPGAGHGGGHLVPRAALTPMKGRDLLVAIGVVVPAVVLLVPLRAAWFTY